MKTVQISPVEFDAVNSAKNSRTSVVERTAARLGFTIARTVAIFKALETQGKGRFVVGRKGYPSRFEWNKVGKTAVTMLPPPPAMPIIDDTMNYEFPLRGGQARIQIRVPRDLTAEEALNVSGIFMTVSDSLRVKEITNRVAQSG